MFLTGDWGLKGLRYLTIAGLLIGFSTSLVAGQGKCARRILGSSKAYSKEDRELLIRHKALANLPQEAQMASVLNYRYSFTDGQGKSIGRSLFSTLPMPTNNVGSLVDFAKLGFEDPIPKRFIIGDGSILRVLIGVDLTPDSPLDREVNRIHRSIVRGLGERLSKENILLRVSQNIADQLGPAISGGFEWDRSIKPQRLKATNFTSLDYSHTPIVENVWLPVVALEDYLVDGEAYCLGQALLAWLVLRSFDIPCRLHLGANSAEAGVETGHSSVELEDGRFVDPAGFMTISPKPYERGLNLENNETDWQFLPGYLTYFGTTGKPTWRVKYKRFPVLVLE